MEIRTQALNTKSIIFLGGIAIAVFFLRDLRSALFPFALAWIICAPIRRLALKISQKTRINFKLCAILCLILILTALGFLLKLGFSLLFGEITSLYNRLIHNPHLILDFFETASNKIHGAGGVFSLFDRLSENEGLFDVAESLKMSFSDAVSHAISSVGQKISGVAVNTASKIPSVILFFIVFFSSCFYFCCDDGKILDFFASLLPTDIKNSLPHLKKSIKEVVFSYVVASLLLCVITFFLVLIGLLCIGCRYAILFSLLVAIIDLLPILGAGVILLPWSLICFLSSDIKGGVALIVIWIIVAVVRQVAEPKLIGKRIGLHPLATLAAVYIGGKLAGVAGIISGPLIAVAIKEMVSMLKGKKHK